MGGFHLKRKAEAIAYGAATIVNAIALSKGAAFGIDLWTKAEVELSDSKGTIEVSIKDEPQESSLLAEKTVMRVLKHFGEEGEWGASIEVESCIPIARGLKSSSVAANAIALATVKALERDLNDLELVRLGVEAAVEARVTITGAFDDACASYFGDVVLTDNKKRVIEKRFKPGRDLKAILFIPSSKYYTASVDVVELRRVAPLIRTIYETAYRGDYWNAMSLNGFVYSAILRQNYQVALDALSKGAIAAGLSGKGPSMVAVSEEDKVDSIVKVWEKYEGEVRITHLNSEKAHLIG